MPSGRAAERGVAMIAVIITMLLLVAVGSALHTGVIAETQLRGAHVRALAGFYAAESGINRGMGEYRNIFQSFQFPTGGDLAEKSFTLGPRTVKYQLTPVVTNAMVLVPAGQQFAGLSAIRNSYTAASRSEIGGDIEARIGTQFDVDAIPLFQFLAFYANDLEILPGVNMNLHGPVHTNGTMYLNSNATLTIEDCYPNACPAAIPTVQMTASGEIFRGRKEKTECLGTVRISRLTDQNNNGVLDLQTMPCSGQQSSAQLSTWLGSIRHHTPVISVPAPDVVQRGAGLFWNAANLRIVLDLFNPDANGRYPIIVQAQDGTKDVAKTAILQLFINARPGRIFYNDVPNAGSDVDAACTAGNSYCNANNYVPPFTSNARVYPCVDTTLNLFPGCGTYMQNDLMADGITWTARRGGFYSNREHAWVRMLNVNAHDLLDWNRAQAVGDRLFDPDDATNAGVVLFLSVAGPGSTGAIPSPRYGTRVFGSPNLDFPSGVPDPLGLTVVSDQALYVEGNYNVGDVTYPKQPAALIGDTLNVLSSNWSSSTACRNDCQSRKPLAQRPASSTTIYAAYISGVDTTTANNYNGGLENYMRYHETWSGQTCFYRGSFVSLGNAQRSNGQWCGTGDTCNIYNAPGRNFDFDTDFQQVQNLPPLTPQVVSVRQILFTENFR